MAFLAGPSVPLSMAMAQLSRDNRAEPFGPFEGLTGARSPVEAALMQLCGLMNRFMGIIESMVAAAPPAAEDDFMQGWGKDDLESEV